MVSITRGPGRVAAALALALAVLAGAAGAAEDEAALRKQMLALNDVTGEDPIRGQILTLLEDPARARQLVTLAGKVIKEKDQPLNYNALYVLGRVAREVKDWDTGVALYRRAADEAIKLKSGTKIGQAYAGLIGVLFDSGKYAESEKLAREFLEMRGDETLRRLKPMMLRQMIQSLAKQGKTEEANKLLDELIKAQPDNWLTLELRGWVQREAGDFAGAAKTYEEVLANILKDKELDKAERAGFASEIRYILSGVYVDAKQVERAADHLKELLKEEPGNPSYNNDLGYIWADHDMNLDEAERLIRKAIEEDRKQRRKANPDLKAEDLKDNPAYLDSLGWVLFKQKKYKDARVPLEQAVGQEEGRHIEIYDHLAEVCQAMGDKEAAVGAWKKGLEVAGTTRREQQRKAEVEKKLKAATGS